MSTLVWTAIGATAAVLYTVAFIISLGFLYRQLRLLNRQLLAQSYSEIYERMQSEDMREARRRLYELSESPIPFENWSSETIAAVEKICQRYDYFAKMIRYNFLPKGRALQVWAWQVDKLWHVSKPLIRSRRTREGQGRMWEDFQWFATECSRTIKKHGFDDVLPVD